MFSAAVAIALAVIAPTAHAEASTPGSVGDAVLKDPRGSSVPIAQLLSDHPFTVVVFYSGTCPCFAAHVDRLQRLAAEFAPQGVGFVAVDSERHAAREPSPPSLVAPAIPLFRDEDGRLARHLGALYASESYVIDAHGGVRYRGGIDSDRKYLRTDAQPYLREALFGLVSGRAPAFASSKALGCALKLQ
jgi:hypothetical protein